MKKIVLKVPEGRVLQANVLLSQTDRRYSNICIQSESEYQINFHKDHFNWISLHLLNVKYDFKLDNFVFQFTETIEELMLTNNKLAITGHNTVFKKLHTIKFLNTKLCEAFLMKMFHRNYNTIKFLSISQQGFQVAPFYVGIFKELQLDTLHIIPPKEGPSRINH